MKLTGRGFLLPAGILSMAITLTGGAMLLQWGNMLRSAHITGDELLPPIWSYIHPGAAALIAAGWALSAAALVAGIWQNRKKD